jgi:hypothetical protein
LTVSVAVPVIPETITGALPSDVIPVANTTTPPGPAFPVIALTVAVRTVVAFCATIAGTATSVALVAVGGTLTLTLTVPLEPAELVFPAQAAVMVFAPCARVVPLTLNVAVAVDPASERVAVPNEIPPAVNTTAPSVPALPVTGLIVAVKTVDIVCEMAAGVAVTRVLVAVGAPVTVIITGSDVEPATVPLPA